MTKRKNQLSQTLGLMIKTRPFLRARLAVYGVFFFATVGFYTTFVFWISSAKEAVWQLLIIAVAVALALLTRRYLGRYLTYSGHAPHLEAMVAAVKGKTLPKGHEQIEEYSRLVDKQYPDANRLKQLERLIVKTLRDASDLVSKPHQTAAIGAKPPPLRRLRRLIHNLALRRFGDAVFAYIIYIGKPNVWRSARDGVALFAESAEKLTKTAVRVHVVGLFNWLLIAAVILLGTRSIFTGEHSLDLIEIIVVATGLMAAAWVLKTALYNPVAVAWMFSALLKRLDEVGEPDEAWAERLDESSKRYRELNDRAKAFNEERSGTRPALEAGAKASDKEKPATETDGKADESGDESEPPEEPAES